MTWRRILLTGAGGQIGFELARMLPSLGETIAAGRDDFDFTDADAIARKVREIAPDLIVNAAAYTAVDRAEKEGERARLINAAAPGVLAGEAKRLGAVLVHYSTDYVFDGEAHAPYDEDAPVAPRNVYGETKLAGERAIAAAGGTSLVLRTSWVYGLRGQNFLLTMRRLAAEREEIRVVADQTGVPNWSRTLAEYTTRLLATGPAAVRARAGTYHLTCTGETTWFDFARAILGNPARPRLVPITTAEYPTPAARPRYSVLSGARLAAAFSLTLPDWRDALAHCLASERA